MSRPEEFEEISIRNMAQYYRRELQLVARGLKIDRHTIRILKQKELITIQDKRHSQYKLSDLSLRLLKEIAP